MASKAVWRFVILLLCLMECHSMQDLDHLTKNVPLKDSSCSCATEQFINDNLKNMEDKVAELVNKMNSQNIRLLDSQLLNQNHFLRIEQKLEAHGQEVKNMKANSIPMETVQSIIEQNKNQISHLTRNIKQLDLKIEESKDNILLLTNKDISYNSTTGSKELELRMEENENHVSILANNTTLLEMKVTNKIDIVEKTRLKNIPKDCNDIFKLGDVESGVRNIHPFIGNDFAIEAFCDQSYSGGGWTVIQRREDTHDVREDFFRGWTDYETGFGNRTGEYWLGLKAIHALTATQPMELMVRLGAFNGDKAYANYKSFFVGDSNENYNLTIGGYEGDAGDALSENNGQMFTTKDNDNDRYGHGGNCGIFGRAGWWYSACTYTNLNGPAVPNDGERWNANTWIPINWYQFKQTYESLQRAVMMVRPIDQEA